MSTNNVLVDLTSNAVKQIVADTKRQLSKCVTVEDLVRVSDALSSKVAALDGGCSGSKKRPRNEDNCLKDQVAKARKSIRGQIGRRLRAKTSKMRFDVPMVSLEVFAALCSKDVSQLPPKKGAYYPIVEVMPKDLLPGVFEPNVPEKNRLWYTAIDPESGYVKSTYGHAKSLQTGKACELRYKPSTKQLSVSCWNDEIMSWEDCCQGKTLTNNL